MEIQWSLVSFTALAGAGAWLFFCVGVDAFVQRTNKAAFPASLLAVVLLALGGLCSVTHLSHPDRMLGALAHPAPGIFLEALLLGLLAVVAIVFAVLVKRQAGAGVRKALALVGMVLALAFTFSCGSSYLMASQAAWNTPTLPLADWGRVKTVRDVIPTLMPYSRSGATVQYENENGALLALSRNMDLFSFKTLDFSRFSFRCIPGAVSYRTRRRQHRMPLFAVRIGNDRPDEPFGLLALTIRWTQGQTVI